MALGGGTFLTQNKILPGSYINFISASKATATLSDRGVAAFPLVMSWGPVGEVFTVTNEEFQKDCLKLFGYAYADDEMAKLRDLMMNVKSCHFYRLNQNGNNASCAYGKGKYTGVAGNNITIKIVQNEDGVKFDVSTLMSGSVVDTQTVADATGLKDNDYVKWDSTATLAVTAGTPMTGGVDGTVTNNDYQTFLDKIEAYSFNTVGCDTTVEVIKKLFVTWTKRLRDEVGVKFQTVLYKYPSADYEGVISVDNKLKDEVTESGALVYYVTGAEAGCAVNKSLTNSTYQGEFTVDVDYTQSQLEANLKAGKLTFHRVGDDVRILEDINTFVSVTDDKSEDFSSNQTIRVLDQIGNDIATIFNTKYLGKVPNDKAGRIALWNDIVKHHQELETLRAIENFEPDRLTVAQGDKKKAVVVTDYVTPVNAMAQLYMTVIVE